MKNHMANLFLRQTLNTIAGFPIHSSPFYPDVSKESYLADCSSNNSLLFPSRHNCAEFLNYIIKMRYKIILPNTNTNTFNRE